MNYNITETKDIIDHPQHYISETGMEVIDVIEAFTFDLTGITAFDTANILKYVCRWSKKNGIEDLKKAKWYIEHLIEHLEKMIKISEEDIQIMSINDAIDSFKGVEI